MPFLFDDLTLAGIIQEAIVFLDFENMLRVPVFNLSNFDERLRLFVVDREGANRPEFVFCSFDLFENGFHRYSFNGKAPSDWPAR